MVMEEITLFIHFKIKKGILKYITLPALGNRYTEY